jgi:hypothetical protein
MKSERRFSRSAQAFSRRKGGRMLAESTCLACGRTVEGDATAATFQTPTEHIRKEVTETRASNAVELEKVLHFSQQLYAHALTLQELIRNEGEETYEVLRPRYDRQAAQQFEIFYHSLKQPAGVRKRGAGSCE